MKIKKTVRPAEELSPDRIRTIREELGLSQSEAGETIGGGPRAFTKYEAGKVKPAAAVVNLLKILEENPELLETLTGKKNTSTKPSGRSHFEVTGKHIDVLSADQLVRLTRRLLASEAFSYSISGAVIHVPENINAPDAGEDARISWTGGPKNTRYLRCRLNQFQLKAGKIDNKKAGKEVLDSRGNIKNMVQSALEASGTYTLLCAHGYTRKEIQKKELAIKNALKQAGLETQDHQIVFYDSSMIAEWVNTHPSVSVWLLEQTEMSSIGKFRSWAYWHGSSEHNVKFIEDPRLINVRSKLLQTIVNPRTAIRVLGPSGTGKSRLTLEAFKGIKKETNNNLNSLKDLILYVDEQLAGSPAVKHAVQNLADSSTRAIVVVDRCETQTHMDLSNLVKRLESNLSLITIDDQPPFEERDDTIIVEPSDDKVINGILKDMSPNLTNEDHNRLVKFSQGFPKIATLLGESWSKGKHLAIAPKEIVENIVIGREQTETDLLFRGAQILSVFGVVYESEIENVANLKNRLKPEDLRTAIRKLEGRRIIQRKGRAFMVQPRPVALCLAEMVWEEWGEKIWDEIITGPVSESLKERAFKQLSLLGSTKTGVQIGEYLLREDGPLDSVESLVQPGRAEILSRLSEINPEGAVYLLERNLGVLSSAELKKINNDSRRHIVWALEKISFCPETFEQGAKLMLNLAVAETENYSNNATGLFQSFFPVHLGNTEANSDKRFRVIDDALNTKNEQQLIIVVEALLSGAKTNFFSRSVGAETHGTRPSREPWQPKTEDDLWNYIESCCDRLIELSKRTDDVGAAARKGLGHKFRSLVTRPLTHVAEKAVKEIVAIHGTYWPEAYESLGDVFAHDIEGIPEENLSRIKKLLIVFQPQTLEDKLQLLVIEMPWDYPCDEKHSYKERAKIQKEAVESLAHEFLQNPDKLKSVLNRIQNISTKERRGQRMGSIFGYAIAEKSTNPTSWLELILRSLEQVQPKDRDFEFLAGYLSGLAKTNPKEVEKFKKLAAESSDLAPALPSICWRMGIQANDIHLVSGALKAGLIKPWGLMQWSGGGVLAKLLPSEVSSLFDLLMDMEKEGFSVAIDLIGMYTFGRKEILEELIPQIKLAAEKSASKTKERISAQMEEHHFQEIMKWILEKGRDDADA